MQALNRYAAKASEWMRGATRKLYLWNCATRGSQSGLIVRLYLSDADAFRRGSPRHEILSRVGGAFQVAVLAFGFAQVVIGLEVDPKLGLHFEKVSEA